MNHLFHQVRIVPKHLPKNRRLPLSYSALNWIRSSGVIDALWRANDKKMESAPGNKPKPLERSYLSAAVESISPWGGSRASTPKATTPTFPGEGSGLKNQHGGDHSTNHWHGWSTKNYPPDCPPLNPRWFHAVDIPKRKPKLLKTEQEETKPAAPPKKFVTFSEHDSRAIEAAYQKLVEDYGNGTDPRQKSQSGNWEHTSGSAGQKANTSINEAGNNEEADRGIKVPVQEDFLFDVDIEKRELSPVYWLGAIFDVRRGSWFYQEGSVLKPCEENLATQLEEGYLKVKPFRYPKPPEKNTVRPLSVKPGEEPRSLARSGAFGGTNRNGSPSVTPKGSAENLKIPQHGSDDGSVLKDSSPPHQPQTHRLFGTHMNSVVTYQDDHVAWISTDNIMSRVSSTVYQKFAGGGYLGGVKVVRGYSEPGKTKDTSATDKDKGPKTPTSAAAVTSSTPEYLQLDERQQKLLKRRSAPPSTSNSEALPEDKSSELREAAYNKLNSIGADAEAEAERKRDEKEIQNDYNDRDDENQGRNIQHLILVTHGIGQRLGMRTESVNFVHDVNALRQTLKTVYGNSADLQALNGEIDKLPKNCRVQVLPICWRHLLDFPRKGVRQNRKEHDLGDAFGEEEEYPSLDDITVEGVPFVRSLITDLALDILLYQSAYREHISSIVLTEANRIYNLFRERNPEFSGKVSLIGHSLGSAILFDILCHQRETKSRSASSSHYKSRSVPSTKSHGKSLEFDFEVEDFYCLGSPIGLFQMLKGRTIAARNRTESLPAESPMDMDSMQDPFLATGSGAGFSSGEHISSTTGLPYSISSPKCARLYNIFHPTDPISYRLEPLIAPAMSSMKPQLLPYTKKGIFGANMNQGITGIGAKVGQSVSGLWSSLSSGIASSLLNRSLGLTGEDVERMQASNSSNTKGQSAGAGTNITAGVIPDHPTLQREHTTEKMRQLAEDTAAADRDGMGTAPTLIDDEIETLYAGFQKRRRTDMPDSDRAEVEERAKKLRREEMKVRALNQNGRVDFSIQESVLDFNPINTIASHLSYWADEDVSHFLIGQLLSRHRTVARLNNTSDSSSKRKSKK
ncbi:hypothetical protein sscle_09g071460 [Sclerotinia sclerotiorum 1980 UF-70]|uniref:DDHD domain-containing protein n=1 Tax=Sclerotinia sclerotiorum (strain ATCC 18683 / 1980 / Ss-1) TaxID=665079 RepID=A0A1D9QBR7_SCLS1|nr:hypothetical protein sscle_09g071460 [Sclerotinia sclerotiorum 1980 UF-70]